MPRFLLFSDLHLHTHRDVSLKDQEDSLMDMIGYAVAARINYILFSGDFFHTHNKLSCEVISIYNRFLIMLRDCGIKLVAISGNHDFGDANGHVTALDSVSLVGHFLDKEVVTEIEGLPIYGLNYSTHEGSVKNFLNYAPSDSIVLLHQGVSGVAINNKGFTLNESLSPEMIPDSIIHCFSGHYHSHKTFKHNATIPGAFMQHNWGDVGDWRGFLDVFVEQNKQVHIKKIDSLCGKQFDIFEFDQIPEGEIRTRNLKILNVPNQKIAQELDDQLSLSLNTTGEPYRNVICEVVAPEATKAETIRSESFSTADFFEEYVKSKELSEPYIKLGREIVNG